MTHSMKLAAPFFLATLTTAQVAQAGSATGTMNVPGNVQGSCTVSAVAVNFGSITPGSATDAEGSIGAAVFETSRKGQAGYHFSRTS